jgi:hypothetical protein
MSASRQWGSLGLLPGACLASLSPRRHSAPSNPSNAHRICHSHRPRAHLPCLLHAGDGEVVRQLVRQHPVDHVGRHERPLHPLGRAQVEPGRLADAAIRPARWRNTRHRGMQERV